MPFTPYKPPSDTQVSQTAPRSGFKPYIPQKTSQAPTGKTENTDAMNSGVLGEANAMTKAKKGSLFSLYADLKQSAQNRVSQVSDAFGRAWNENQNPVSTGLQTVGAAAGFAGDVIGSGAKAVAESVVPESIQSGVKQSMTKAIQESDIPQMREKYDAWSKRHPEASADLEAGVNIASLFPMERIGGEAVQAGKNVAKEAIPAANEAIATAGKAAGAVKKAAGETVDAAGRVAKIAAEKPLSIAQDISTAIPENVKRIATSPKRSAEIAEISNKYFNQARTALKETGAATPLEVSGREQLGGALTDLNAKLKVVGEAQGSALKKTGSNIVNTQSAYDGFTSKLAERLGTHLDPQGNLVQAEGRISQVIGNPSDEKLIKMVTDSMETLKRKPTVQQVNDLVDNLQNALYKAKQPGAMPINSKTESIVKSFTSDLNAAAKEAGGSEYANAASEYSRLVQIRNQLNKALGPEMKNAGTLMQKIFSPSGANTKRLIDALEKETGRNIFEHGTLAKFAMDVVKDPRALSLIEKTPTSRAGILDKMLGFALEKVQDPEAVLQRMIKKQKKPSGSSVLLPRRGVSN